ncbi:MAG: glycosyltransferase [Chitinophagaceae bacterium]|nr:glycosyltransferase [Chitinophagaceae bacterium]
MSEQHLHIITHDVPFPADYGGVFDLFYKLKALHALGVRIHLHCFTQGRVPGKELNELCTSVDLYPRKKDLWHFSFRVPFIVNSRKDKNLLANLQKDDHPVLMEGIHCTYYLQTGELTNRKLLVRLHNAEFEYYHQLGLSESSLLKKCYFLLESRLLKRYESRLASKAGFLAVSEKDVELYRKAFHAPDIHYLPVFVPFREIKGLEGKGCFCLYHGNLSVNENESAATWLLKNIFNRTDLPLVIAGKNPSSKLERIAHRQKNTCLVANPSEKEMLDLISKAQINIIPSFNNTGIKIKLLNALAYGRHCLVNTAAVEGSGLEGLCVISDDAASFLSELRILFDQPFTIEDIQKRENVLAGTFNNEKNAMELMRFLS